MGVICGVTTNPSLIAKEGFVFEEVIAEIASIVDGPISGEVKATTTDAEGMIAEGNMMTVASGIATTGKVPFASTFAMFAAGRAFEQIRNSIGYPMNKENVLKIVDHTLLGVTST